MDKKQKAIMIGGAASAVVAGLAPAALADANAGYITLQTTGVSFAGEYTFYDQGALYNGGFGFTGALCDTERDGDGVFVHGKVSGYAYGQKFRNSLGEGFCTYVQSPVYNDPQALYVNYATVETCRDRGTWLPDNCDKDTYYRSFC